MLTKTQAKALTVAVLLAGPGISCSPGDTQNRPTVPSTPADPRLQEVREFVIEDVAAGITPSLSIAVAHNGQVVWAEAFGWADKENKIQATPDTMYRLGSISQSLIATGQLDEADQRLEATRRSDILHSEGVALKVWGQLYGARGDGTRSQTIADSVPGTFFCSDFLDYLDSFPF